MKTPKILLLIATLCLLSFDAMSQTRAERRAMQEQRDAALRAEVSQIVHSGNFAMALVFMPARDGNISGGGAAMFQEQRTVTVRNDSIFGSLPFMGRSSVSHYGGTGGGGFVFEDPIQTGEVVRRNRNYLVSMIVNQPGESLNMSIEIGFTGEILMIIRSNRRADARYTGVLQPAQPPR